MKSCVLKVHIYCDGCKKDLKKLLRKIEGVYEVNIDSEHQTVTVSGSVDSDTLIKKLAKAGKHAELLSHHGNQNQQQHKFSPFDSEDEDDEQPGFLSRQGTDPIEAKMNAQDMPAAQNYGKINNNGKNPNWNLGKKADRPNQNMGMKASPGVVDQEPMNSAAFHGNGPNLPTSAGMGGNTINGLGGFRLQPNNNGVPASYSSLPDGYATGQYPSSMSMNMNGYNSHTSSPPMSVNTNGYNNHTSSSPVMTNMHQARYHAMMQQQQPPVIYQGSHFIPPSTGYYYNYSSYPAQATSSPVPYSPYPEPNYGSDGSAANVFSDENSNGCSIM